MMKKYLKLFYEAIEKRNPYMLPLARFYRATENQKPGSLLHMNTFRRLGKIIATGESVFDDARGECLETVSIYEGSLPVILCTRLKVENELITELEMNIYRGRIDSGYWFAVDDVGKRTDFWSAVVPEEKRASYDKLIEMAAALYDPSVPVDVKATCVLEEMGGIVYENEEYSYAINPHFYPVKPDGKTRAPIPFGMPPNRPQGRDIRIIGANEELGVCAAVAMVDGYHTPYLTTYDNSTCFVPISMIDMHNSTLRPELYEGRNVFDVMMGTCETITILKYFDDELKGYTQYMNMYPYGANSGWRKEEK